MARKYQVSSQEILTNKHLKRQAGAALDTQIELDEFSHIIKIEQIIKRNNECILHILRKSM